MPNTAQPSSSPSQDRRNKPASAPVGRRMGFIYNQYPVTLGFWTQLERELEAVCKPPQIERAYKSNTWAPLEPEKFKQIADAVDYLVVGVGA